MRGAEPLTPEVIVAEDKDKKEEGEEEVKKKKGLPAIVLVAVGAALGGAGVVFLGPSGEKSKEEHVAHAVPVKKFKHPLDEGVQHSFNLGTGRGSKIAKVQFTFIYRAEIKPHDPEHPPDPEHPHPDVPNDDALNSLRANWDLMMSRVLITLKGAAADELNGNMRILEHKIKEDLNRSLFGGGEAEVIEIVWGKILVQ